jgi:hypothetical protein
MGIDPQDAKSFAVALAEPGKGSRSIRQSPPKTVMRSG